MIVKDSAKLNMRVYLIEFIGIDDVYAEGGNRLVNAETRDFPAKKNVVKNLSVFRGISILKRREPNSRD